MDRRTFHSNGRRWAGLAGWLLTGSIISAAHAEQIGAIEPRNSTEPTPPSSWQTKIDYTRVAVSRSIVLPAIADAEVQREFDIPEPGQPLRIGVGRQVPAMDAGDLAPTLTWTALPRGGRVAAFSVRSPRAGAIRVAVRAVRRARYCGSSPLETRNGAIPCSSRVTSSSGARIRARDR